MAEQIRRELKLEPRMVHGHYGEFKVLVDGETLVDGGAKVVIGIMPSAREVIDAVREKLSAV